MMFRESDFYKLMLVTHRQNTALEDYLQFIQTCAQAGITSVQLREKHQTPEFVFMFGQKLKGILDPLQIPLIINDDVELTLKLNASGVHLGQADGDPQRARTRLGPDKIIGVSIDKEEDLMKANQLPIDYVGIGAIYPTTSKKNVTTIWGVQRLKQLSAQSNHPVIGIGGINEDNASDVISSGACGIAIIAALHDAEQPNQVARHLRLIIDNQG